MADYSSGMMGLKKIILLLLLNFALSATCRCGETKAPSSTGDAPTATPANPRPRAADKSIMTLPIEQLMNIQVTSVSKSAEPVLKAPAAIYVITQDDIRRSGVNSIPEALRMAPGMTVGRVTANQWAIGSRGFTSVFATKLLVLIDGRTVYTPVFSGTLWDVQDTLMEDIDRIEVIRGPGATLWGSNAVNGVINVITKNANQTQGGLAVASAGTEERVNGAVRYGGKPVKTVAIRGYAKYFDNDDQVLPGGRDTSDDWRMGRGGFRMDWAAAKDDAVTFQGDIYKGKVGETIAVPILDAPYSQTLTGDGKVSGGNFQSRWEHTFSETSSMQLAAYYDRTDRIKIETADDARDTLDLDFQYQFQWNRHDVVCGAGYRVGSGETKPGILRVPQRTTELYNAFVQDDITLIRDKLKLTIGSKFEQNDFTGFEIQPSLRLLWAPNSTHSLWTSVSRAVRIPSLIADGSILDVTTLPPGALGPGTPATRVTSVGNKDAKAERLLAYELGYRVKPHARVSLDLAAFYNDYDNLLTVEPRAPISENSPAPPHLLIPAKFDNLSQGASYGAEAVASVSIRKWWRMQATYSFLRVDLRQGRSQSDAATSAEGMDPRNQAGVRSMFNLPHNVELDFWLRYMDSIPEVDVPSYVAGDVRVGWRPTRRLELSLLGKNLFDNQHPEFSSTIPTQRTEVQNSVSFKITLKF